MPGQRTTRRGFVRRLGLGATGLMLAACGGLPSLPPGGPLGLGGARPSLVMWSLDPGELELKKWLTDTTALIAREGNFDLKIEYHDLAVMIQKETDGIPVADLPDLALTFMATQWAHQGWSRDVSDLYSEIGREGGGWYDAADSITRIGGRRSGIPVIVDLGVLFARHDLFTAVGLTLPIATFDDLVDGLKRLTGGGQHGLGFALRDGAGRPTLDILFAHGGRLFDQNSTPTIDTPRNRAGLAAVADLVATHKVVPPVATAWDQGNAINAYLNGQIAAIATNIFFLEVMRRQQAPLLATTVAMPWPAARGGAPAVSADSPQFVVKQQSPHGEQAMQIIRRLMSRQHYPALLSSVEPFGFSPLSGYKDSPVYNSNPLMRQIQHEVMPHAVSRYADGARTPVLDAVSETLDAEVSQMAFGAKPLGGAIAALEARAIAAHDALPASPTR